MHSVNINFTIQLQWQQFSLDFCFCSIICNKNNFQYWRTLKSGYNNSGQASFNMQWDWPGLNSKFAILLSIKNAKS